jgi:hypothetical protein
MVNERTPVTLADYQDALASAKEVIDFLQGGASERDKEIATLKATVVAKDKEIAELKSQHLEENARLLELEALDLRQNEVARVILQKIEWAGPDATCPLCKCKKGPHDHLCPLKEME